MDNTQALLETAFFNSFQPMILFNRDYSLAAYNRSAEQLAMKLGGLHLSSATSFHTILPPEDRVSFEENIKQSFSGKDVKSDLVSIITGSDNNEYWFTYLFSPVRTAGEIPRVLVTIIDITDRKTVIDRIAQNEKRFRSLLRNISDVLTIIDERGIIHYQSESIERILGYKYEKLTKRNIRDLIHQDSIRSFDHFLENLLTEPENNRSLEIQFQHTNGDWLYLEIIGSNHLADASIRGIVLSSRDVTQRKHYDEILKRISLQNELILESIGEGICGINLRGMVTFVNPAAIGMLEKEDSEIIGKYYEEIFHQHGADRKPLPRDGSPVAAALRDGRIQKVENVFFQRGDGSLFPVEYFVNPVIHQEKITGVVVSFNDITDRIRNEEELKKAKEEAEAANQAKSDFLAHMSHEIRTPMNSILGFLEILSLSELSKKQQEYVAIITGNARTLLGIINDILDFSKIEKGKLELDEIEFHPHEIFESTIETFSVNAQSKNLSLTADIDPHLPARLIGDPLRIKQVLNNLISNAIKFTDPSGEIKVTIGIADLKRDRCRVDFAVSDTGVGIPPSKQRIIFEAFTQAESSVSRRYGGTGLGLSISSNLVRMMGGELQIDSEEGRGSTFSFSIELGIPAGLSDDDTAPGEELSSLRVMVSPGEKGDEVVASLAFYLRTLGIDFAEGNATTDDLSPYDLLFLISPRLDADEISTMTGSLTLPTVLITRERRRHSIEEALEHVDAILMEPVHLSKLLSTLQEIVAARSAKAGVPAGDELRRQQEILVAEDNIDNQKLMRLMLEQLGFTCDIAENGKRAVELFRKKRYGAVLMDINMPEQSGTEALREIRRYERSGGKVHTPIIALTAKVFREDEAELSGAGFDGHLKKPVDMSTLKSALRTVLPPLTRTAVAHEEKRDIATIARALGLEVETARDLIRDFMSSLDDYLQEIESAAQQGVPADIERAAHKLKGIAATYRFTTLADIAAKIESSASEGSANVEGLLQQLEVEIAAVKSRGI